MNFIKHALANYPEQYDLDTMTITTGKFQGFKFFDRIPEYADFCIDIVTEEIILCIHKPGGFLDGYFLGNKKTNDCFSISISRTIPVNPEEKVVKYFLDNNTFTGFAYTQVFSIIQRYFPAFLKHIKTEICSCCGDKINNLDEYKVDGKIICLKCFYELYKTCERCGDTFKIEENNKEESLCPRCAKRDFVLPYHRYSPPIEFFGNNKGNNIPYLGVELEVDEGGEYDKTVKKLMGILNTENKIFAYCMHDGSLNDGFEIITQPATLDYHKQNIELYKNTFNYLIKCGYLSHDTSTCGIHVHFNRDFYRDNEELYITRLLYLVDKFWDEIVKFSRRNQRRIDRYSKKVDISPQEYYKKSNKSENHDYHYYAVNISNQNTIEFRMFKGSLNINTFIATLQFVNNCIVCARERSAEEIQSMDFEELITGRCCKNYWKTRKDKFNTEE